MADVHGPPLPSIVAMFRCVDDCPVCLGSGTVCEDHPNRPWAEGDGCCGAPGMPCPGVAGLHG